MVKVRKIVVRVDKDNAEIFYADKAEVHDGAVFILDENQVPLAVFLTCQYWRYVDEPPKGNETHTVWTGQNDTSNYWNSYIETENWKFEPKDKEKS